MVMQMSDIIKITNDKERARALYEIVAETLEELEDIKKAKPHRKIKEYYELIIQLITGIMYSDGFKTLSHLGLIDYLKKEYEEFSESEIKIIDSLRKLRHGIIYYGRKSGEEFLINNEEEIISIINKIKNESPTAPLRLRFTASCGVSKKTRIISFD